MHLEQPALPKHDHVPSVNTSHHCTSNKVGTKHTKFRSHKLQFTQSKEFCGIQTRPEVGCFDSSMDLMWKRPISSIFLIVFFTLSRKAAKYTQPVQTAYIKLANPFCFSFTLLKKTQPSKIYKDYRENSYQSILPTDYINFFSALTYFLVIRIAKAYWEDMLLRLLALPSSMVRA